MFTIITASLCEPCNPGGYACYAWKAFDERGTLLATDSGLLLKGEGSSNNVAAYGSVIKALRYARDVEWCDIRFVCSSQLICNQLTGEWGCNEPNLQRYYRVASALLELVDGQIHWVRRDQCLEVQQLARAAYIQARRGGRS